MAGRLNVTDQPELRYNVGDWAIFDSQWCTYCWQDTGPFAGRVVSFTHIEHIDGSNSVHYLVDPIGIAPHSHPIHLLDCAEPR